MVDLDKFVLENCLSIDSINEYVDDYSIFSHYIGEELELGRKYSSPLREGDSDPSFCLYEVYGKYSNDVSAGKIIFKDHATGLKGNAFKFIQHLFSKEGQKIPFYDVLNQINVDFDLGLSGTPKTFTPKAKIIDKAIQKRERPKIEIVSKNYSERFLNYFLDKYDIIKDTLQFYNALDVRLIYYTYTKQENVTIYPKSLAIAYKIGKYYKIYMPFESKEFKFRNDFPSSYVEGFMQLKYEKSFVIITKAMKEVMFFRQHFDIDSVAGKSENTPINPILMQRLFDSFEHVILWLDRDKGGKKATEYYQDLYGDKLVYLNYQKDIEQKDVTDRYEHLKSINQKDKALKEIKTILCPYMK